MKMHIKGFVLQQIARTEGMWDQDVTAAVCREYGKAGPYWAGSVRVILTDLYSGGLLSSVEEKYDVPADKMRFCFRVSDFGRARMEAAGLL